MKKELQSVKKDLNALGKRVDKLIAALQKADAPKPKKAVAKKPAKSKTVKKAAPKKAVAKNTAPKKAAAKKTATPKEAPAKKVTFADTVYNRFRSQKLHLPDVRNIGHGKRYHRICGRAEKKHDIRTGVHADTSDFKIWSGQQRVYVR